MPQHPFSPSNAPYGANAPALDWYVLVAPSADAVLPSPGRAFTVVTAGVVSVRAQAGSPAQTFTAPVGLQVLGVISEVLEATTADLVIYSDTGE